MKLLTLTALTLFAAATGVLADKKLSYSCDHNNKFGHMILSSGTEHKDGGVFSERYAKYIFAQMPDWSGGKYSTKHSELAGEITVVCNEVMESKDKAVEAITEQERIVKEHQ
jgi:hypothetical protein